MRMHKTVALRWKDIRNSDEEANWKYEQTDFGQFVLFNEAVFHHLKNVEKTSQPVSEVQDSRMNNTCKQKQENVSKKESTAHLANPINALDPLRQGARQYL